MIGNDDNDRLGERVALGDEVENLKGDAEDGGDVACLADSLADFGRFLLAEQLGGFDDHAVQKPRQKTVEVGY